MKIFSVIGLLFFISCFNLFGQSGILDNTFSSDGIAIEDFPKNEILWGTALQPDGKILLAGTVDSSGLNYDLIVWCLSTSLF